MSVYGIDPASGRAEVPAIHPRRQEAELGRIHFIQLKGEAGAA